MIPRYSTPTRLARATLLIAALLQFAAAGVGPWVHLEALLAPTSGAFAGAPAEGDGGGSPAPHDELSCVFCHTLPAAALLADGPALVPASLVRFLPPAAEPLLTAPRPERRSPLARGPPLA